MDGLSGAINASATNSYGTTENERKAESHEKSRPLRSLLKSDTPNQYKNCLV